VRTEGDTGRKVRTEKKAGERHKNSEIRRASTTRKKVEQYSQSNNNRQQNRKEAYATAGNKEHLLGLVSLTHNKVTIVELHLAVSL
jgi:hypothetical protein